MIHIVFQRNDVDILGEAIQLDPTIQGDIVQICDDFAVGPIKDIFTETGWDNRRQWWREVLAGGDYDGIVDDGSVPDDTKTVAELVSKLKNDPAEVIWIWAAQNKHDVSGYYWLVSQLKDFQGRIFILYLNNLPFISEKGNIFYPVNLFQIPAKEFLKAKKLARAVTGGEFEIDSDEWTKLANEDKPVRLLEGGKKLVQRDHDLYDQELKSFLTGEWQKASKFIHHYLAKSKHITGDAYLLWRMKLLIQSGEIEAQGELKNMKDFEIKSKTATPAPNPQPV